jgi:hypothetical protein
VKSGALTKSINNTRQPTHDEAVEIMGKALTDQQRRANLAHWREWYGDAFARRVEAEFKRKGKR